jgi:hypothetical protein
MFMQPQPATADPQNPAEQQAGDAQYFRQILLGLIDIGADLARLVHTEAKAAAATPRSAPTAEPASAIAPGIIPDIAAAFERISRAVRRCIALARKVAEPIPSATDHAAEHRTAARRRIIREVEDTIQRTAAGADAEAEALHGELLDRLDGPDLDADIANRPIADIIADICRDFGLAALPGTHPWKRRTAEDIAALSARAARPRAAPVAARATPPRSRPDPAPSNPGPHRPRAAPTGPP